ncbi:flagellar hook assembly protein FlgD [Nevskia sp.]|uniref:flagellar hook assembly protein FlgD n=1 Tax=Nevskia sp. TaxID=1929292 RepID=UPI0025EEE6F0|nr:flagellar hook assembly protein FlgD [Nevskia sp.]
MTTAVASNPYADLGLTQKTTAKKADSLGQADFLKLMTTQLQNQDPLKPLESNEFLGQIAQFSTVSGIQDLQKSFTSLSTSLTSSQSLQAAGLVGHGVLYPSSTGFLDGQNGLSGGVDIPASGQLVVEIVDGSGQVVRRLDYGTQPAGTSYFNWDGKNTSGETLPSGNYGIRASLTQGSNAQAASTLAAGVVQSVSLGANGLSLNLAGLGPIAFDKVRQII